jgi:hypothetical protein
MIYYLEVRAKIAESILTGRLVKQIGTQIL